MNSLPKALVLLACCLSSPACKSNGAAPKGTSVPSTHPATAKASAAVSPSTVVAPAPPASDTTNGTTVILDVAMYGGAQLPARVPQSGWLVLCSSDSGTALRATSMTLVPYFDDMANDAPGQQTGREVKATNCEAPLLLVSDSALRAHPVRDAQIKGQQIAMGDSNVELSSTPGNQADLPARLSLQGQQSSLVLLESTYSTSLEYKIRWAGDLDDDGALDLVLEENQEATFLHLFLSRDKPVNGHWKPSATTYWGGC